MIANHFSLFFLHLILLFFWFYLFIPEKNANQCMYSLFLFISLLKGKVAVKFERFNLAFWSCRQGDQLNIVTEVVGLISWQPKRLFWGYQYSHFCSGSLAELIRFHKPPLPILFFFISLFVCLFILLMGMWLQAYIIVFLKYQLMIFYHKSTIMHTYVDIYIEIYSQLTHTPTQLHFVYNIVVVVWSLVVSTSLTDNIFIKL